MQREATRTATMTDVTTTKIRVGRFEVLKHTSSSATENTAILSCKVEGDHKVPSKKGPRKRQTYAHISSSQGRLRIMAIGSRPNLR